MGRICQLEEAVKLRHPLQLIEDDQSDIASTEMAQNHGLKSRRGGVRRRRVHRGEDVEIQTFLRQAVVQLQPQNRSARRPITAGASGGVEFQEMLLNVGFSHVGMRPEQDRRHEKRLLDAQNLKEGYESRYPFCAINR